MSKGSPDTLNEIKNLMERSSRLSSLSGLSAISAGMTAMIGSVIASVYLHTGYFGQVKNIMLSGKSQDTGEIVFLVILALVILLISSVTAILFSSRNAKKQGYPFWDFMAKRVFLNHFIFLLTGGMFCAVLMWYGIWFLIVPSMLIFYGLALINISKFTFNEIAALGILEICLGMISSIAALYPLLTWTLGFGIFHLAFGIFVYVKYDKAAK